MKHEPDLPGRARRLPSAADFREAKAAHALDGDIDHVVIGQWLLTWGKPDRKDFAEWLRDQDG